MESGEGGICNVKKKGRSATQHNEERI